MFRLFFLIILLLFTLFPVHAQEDALNLPTELYVLLNEGRVERYGLGAAGVSTVTPEGEVVIDFGVAPDGVWMAYRTEDTLKLLNTLDGATSNIQSGTIPPFRGLGQTIAWSPDASVVAYTVDAGIRFYFIDGGFFDIPISPILHLMWSPGGQYIAAGAEENIWWIYRRDGLQMVLQSAIVSSVGLAWVDNTILLFTPATGGLFLMDLSRANAQAQIHDETVLFQLPVLSGDRTVSLFGKIANDNTLSNDSGFLYNVTLNGTPTIQQVSQNSLDLNNLSWSPAGNLLLALRGGVLALVEPVSAQGFSLPMTGVAAYGWGAMRVKSGGSVSLPEALHFLADDGTGVVQLWRLPRDGSAAVLMTAGDTSVELYAVAPDGRTLAYISDGELMLLPAGADASMILTTVEQTTSISFSGDGQTIAYDNGDQILMINAAGGESLTFLQGYTQPHYSPSGESLLLRLADGDLGLIRLESGEILRLGAYDGAAWMGNGQLIVYGSTTAGSTPGLYLISMDGASPALLFTVPTGLKISSAADAGSGKIRLILTRESAPSPLIILDAGLNGELTDIPTKTFIAMPQLSPDGRYIAGYVDATGALVVYDLVNASELVLRQPPSVKDFRWISFR
jgi:WD40 repeat protein